MEDTVRWVIWLLISMFIGLLLIIAFPAIALWIPRTLGFM
jgi:TRAP-type C4-dicarboxylate transport system permease large subunit